MALQLVTMAAATATALLALLVVVAAGSKVTLVENGYTGVVIGVDERVDVLQCQELLQNLQVSPQTAGWSVRAPATCRWSSTPLGFGPTAGCTGVVTEVTAEVTTEVGARRLR